MERVLRAELQWGLEIGGTLDPDPVGQTPDSDQRRLVDPLRQSFCDPRVSGQYRIGVDLSETGRGSVHSGWTYNASVRQTDTSSSSERSSFANGVTSV